MCGLFYCLGKIMDRQIIYPGQIAVETDLLNTNRNTMISIGKLAGALFGTAGVTNGLTVGPSSPLALTVDVAPGEIYQNENVDNTAYSSLPADTTDAIVKQGIMFAKQTLACAAPGTAGFSINYLIQATYQDSDTGAVALPYYNASNPSQAYSGPNNSGVAQNTKRAGIVVLSAKAGTAAATGTQTTPAPDTGYIALASVTVANGQSTIVAGNITAIAPASPPMVDTSAVYSDLASTATGKGAFLIGYKAPGSSLSTTVKAQLDGLGVVSVTDPRFGADPTFATDSTAAFLAAIAYLQANNGYRGGTIHAPAGRYKLSATLAFTCYVAGQVHNIRIVGDGPQATTLDFSAATAGSNGIEFTWGYHFEIADLTVTGAPQDNISICKPSGFNGANSAAIYAVRNVRSQSAGRYGVYSANSFMGRYSDVWCGGNAGGGFFFAGFHTSLEVTRCWASTNTGAGWTINGVVYSHYSACGADSNTLQGWKISNVGGVTLTSCGAEANAQDAFYVYTSTASATGLPATSQDVHGLTFVDCFAIGNSTQTVGGFASFISAVTANSRPIEFKIQGGSSAGNASGDVALVLFGTSGAITCHKELFDDYTFTTADAISGTVEVKNQTMSGRRTVATIASAQSLTSGTLTTAALAASPVTNDMGATVSSSAVVIPRGVNKVRISACADIAGNASGVRQLFIQKNGANLLGLPAVTTSGIAAGDSILSTSSGAISVVAGDTFTMQVYQNSGGALNLVQNPQTFLTVEAVS